MSDIDPAMAVELLIKFANHRVGCHCFICRALTPEQEKAMNKLRYSRGDEGEVLRQRRAAGCIL